MDWQNARETTLQKFVGAKRPGLITDVDGTISPIVAHPDLARVSSQNRELLLSLQNYLALTAVISGRAAADVQARVNVPGVLYVGNHGLERWQNGTARAVPEAARYRPQLEEISAAIESHLRPGMLLEDKGVTLSLHYRQAADPAQAKADLLPVLRGLAAQQGLNMFEGRMVFEFRPPIEKDKGSAFRELVAEHELDAALYLGDDTTDVAALQAAVQMRNAGECYSLAIGVASADTPPAVLSNSDLSASGVAGVTALLAWLLDSFKASST